MTALPAAPVAAAPTGAVPAPAAVSLAPTTDLLDGATEVLDPPADALGTPASSTVIRSDDLLISDQNHGAVFQQWADVKPGIDGFSDQARIGWGDAQRPLLNRQYPTSAGRFIGTDRDHVLSLRWVTVGDGQLWQLGTDDDDAHPEWHKDDLDLPAGSPAVAGRTYALLAPGDGPYESTGHLTLPIVTDNGYYTPPRMESPSIIGALDGPGPTRNQEWSLVPARGDVGPGWYKVANRADGMCLDVWGYATEDGTPVLTGPCDAYGPEQTNQLFQLTEPCPGTTVLTNLNSGKALTRGEDGKLIQTSFDGDCDASDTLWRLREIRQPGGTVPTWSAPAAAHPATPYDMATGDLDRVVAEDGDGQYHDEAVVAFAGEDHRLNVRVIDYNAPAGLLATAHTQELPVIGTMVGSEWHPGSIGTAVGDFDGDSANEIAVTWQDAGGFHVTMLEYESTGQRRELEVVVADQPILSVQPGAAVSMVSGYADTVAGDFDGTGRDSVAIGYAANYVDRLDLPTVARIGVAGFGGDLKPRTEGVRTLMQNTQDPLTVTPSSTGSSWTERGIRLAAGLFRVDEANGADLHRRQLAVAVTATNDFGFGILETGTAAQILQVSPARPTGPAPCAQPCAVSIDDLTKLLGVTTSDLAVAGTQPMSLVAGGFAGQGQPEEIPLWGLALASEQKATGGQTAGPRVHLLRVDGDTLVPTEVRSGSPQVVYTLTAYDPHGESLVLGAPVVFTVNSLQKANVIAAQPPAHLDWLDGDFDNTSRSPEFSVDFGTETGESFSSTHTSTASSTIGVSEHAESKNTVKTGLFGVAGVGGSLKIGQKFSKEWESGSKNLSAHSTSTTQSITQTGTDDDIVTGNLTTHYIYRYPILGGPLTRTDGTALTTEECADACYGYYEIQVPGSTTFVNGYGRSYDWYQPSWQNGNALSYPELESNRVPLPDLGSYSYVDDTGTTVTKTQALFNSATDVGGGRTTAKLSITDTQGGEHERSSSSTMMNSVEVEVGLTAKFTLGPIGSVESKNTIGMGFDKTDSWAQLEVGETETETATEFGLKIPQIGIDRGYRVGTAYYHDEAGTQKVVHGVDLTASAQGSEWWRRTYGQQPDPALNLPNASVMTKNDLGVFDEPKWSNLSNRQRIRGFHAIDPETAAPYGDVPTAGEPVQFRVQVHNYSLATAHDVPVRFYAVPVDEMGLDPTGPATSIGGAQTISGIAPQGSVDLTSPTWTAATTGGAPLQNWRIFVVLNEDAAFDEIHPLEGAACPEESTRNGSALVDPMTGQEEELACGQNNQGYGEVSVLAEEPTSADHTVQLSGSSLAPADAAVSATADPEVHTVVQDQPVTGLVHATSTAHSADIRHVLVFDGPPSEGKVVAATTLEGAVAGEDHYAPFTWTPDRPGRHTLHQVLLGASIAEDQDVQVMTVDVAPATPPVPAGIADLQVELATLSGSGAVTGPIVRLLEKDLDTTQRLIDRNQISGAVRRLERFVDRLDDLPGRSTVTPEADRQLRQGAQALIDQWTDDPAPTVAGLKADVAAFTASGAVTGPVSRLLDKDVDIAQRLADRDRTSAAVRRLERFIDRLDDPPGRSTVTTEARRLLGEGARTLIDKWR